MSSAQQFGKYTLVERIAVGGMAEIYRAKTFGAAGFEKEMVIKRILPQFSLDDDFVRMFIDEARIAAKLSHPNVVQIYDFDSAPAADGDSYYIAMELVEGKDLRHILKESIRRNAPLALSHCVHIAVETLKGLHYAHTKQEGGRPLNIVHRDVSPHNILVSYSGDVKVTDFGIAKAAARASATSNGMVKGKLAYMSPEQVTGQALDRRTDVFSAGICLYEMLTRTRLFVAETEGETIARVRDATVPPMRQRNPAIPPDLEQVVMRMLAHSLDQRFQSAADAARALSGTSVYSANEAIGLGEYVRRLFPETAKRQVSAPPPAATPNAPTMRPAIASASKSASTSGVIEPMNNPAFNPRQPAAAQPVSELKTAMLEAGSPEAAKVAAAVAAQNMKVGAGQSTMPEMGGAPAGGAAATPVSELKTAMLDANSPEAAKVAAALAARQSGKGPSSIVVDGSGPTAEGQAPAIAQVQAQIAAAAAAAAAVAAASGSKGGVLATMAAPAPSPIAAPSAPSIAPTPNLSAPQRTMMYDGPPVNLAPKGPAPLQGARSLPPLPTFPEPATWQRWAIGPGIMVASAVLTVVALTFSMPPGTMKKLFAKGEEIVETHTSKMQLNTNPSRASVALDGKTWPKFTPTQIEAPVGKKVHLTITLDGYKPAEADVIFAENPRPLTINLDREDPDAVAKTHTTTVSSDKGNAMGKIDIYVHPWATVYVDGVRQRRTPITNLEIKPGPHTINLENDEKGKKESIPVVIKAGINPEIRREWGN